MIAIAPGERIPRHRIIGKLLQLGEYDLVNQEIRAAEETVGLDPPISRYKVRSAIRRAETTEGILEEDRRAMLMEAERLALQSMSRFQNDKYAYMSYAEVATSLANLAGDYSLVDQGIDRLGSAYERLLDPQLAEALDDLTQMRSRVALHSKVLAEAEDS